ncbi:hypothetical protein GCM10027586_01420 [Kineococcus gypseus]|uniref:hypothetical protein n=1 Tax=Kineococcus gypseus TaxID=1637102 RepID=UPI003D7DDF01
MTSSKNTLWIAGTGVLAVLVLLATWFLLISPKRAEAVDIATQEAGVRQSNARLAAQTELLRSQFATLGDRQAELAAARAALPDATQVPALIRQFSTYAKSSGVVLSALEPGSIAPYAAQGPADAAAAATGAVAGGLLTQPLTVTVDGSFAGTELFVKNLQADMQRFLLVDSVAVRTGTTEGSVTTSITGRVFVLQDAATAATSLSQAAAQPATTPDASASSTETTVS